MGRKRKSDWKPVALPEDFLSKNIDGLVSIEELTAYNIENNEIVLSESTHQKTTSEEDNVSPSKKIKKSTKNQEIEVNNGWIVSPLNKKNILAKRNKSGTKNRHSQSKFSDDKNEQHSINSDTSRILKTSLDVAKKIGNVSYTVPPGMEFWSSYKLPTCILQALFQQGFKKPTEIQAQTLNASIQGRRDILGAAETGSGKTLAFGIPIIHGIIQQKRMSSLKSSKQTTEGDISDNSDNLIEAYKKKVGQLKIYQKNEDNSSPIISWKSDQDTKKLFALVLTPTRELAIQVKNHLASIAKFAGLKVAVVIGGLAAQKQERLLKRRPEIVVATPGRLWEMIESGIEHLQKVSDISFLAIDETDRMLEKGHFQELQTLLERINVDEYKKKKRQNFVFSATLTLVHDAPKYISKKKGPSLITPGQKLQQIIASLGITQPKIVDITQDRGTASTLTEARIVCPLDDKDFYLYYFILRHTGRTLVFCNSISCVRRLSQILEVLKLKLYPLHANMQQRQRLKNLERFRDNPNGLLLATDVAARGLDIPNVQHVIHYQVPRTAESYVHRSGRTARAKKEGLTVLIMDSEEVSCYIKLCRTLGRDQDLPEFPVDDSLLNTAKTRISLARQIESLEHTLRKNNSQTNWFQKTAKEMDLLLDEDYTPKKFSDEDSINMKRKINGLKKQLESLLGQRMLPRTASLKFPNLSQAKLGTEDAVEVVKKNSKKRSLHLKINK